MVGDAAVRLSDMAIDVDGSTRDRGNSPAQDIQSAVCENLNNFITMLNTQYVKYYILNLS